MEKQPKTREQEKKKDRVLITGSKGTIGNVLTQSLRENFELIEVDIKIPADNKNQFNVDIANLEAMETFFRKLGRIDSIVHLAANPNANAPWKEILRNNIIGTKIIYECARKHNVPRVIFASSTHLFGGYEGYPQASPLGRPIGPDDPPRSDGDYGASKGFGEILARQYYDLYGIETICLRIGSVSSNDKPIPPYEKIFLSHRDVSDVFRVALDSKIPFGIYFVTSENSDPVFDIRSTKQDLGFSPSKK